MFIKHQVQNLQSTIAQQIFHKKFNFFLKKKKKKEKKKKKKVDYTINVPSISDGY